MTNLNIIANEAIQTGLYSKDEITNMIMRYGTLLIKTFAEWKKLGFKIKKGEHAKLICNIWRKKTNKKNTEEINENEEVKNETEFYKKTAYFFTLEQVEKMN